ncbi:hypothetical protein K7X08_024496 [Anisodus acutangulus]|uniref:Thiol-disulfide oxidoreductase DCC n=1 Tax=Anisodus acutangulus TaxID=402998 RepID=A0A9Q1M8X7_9SOLA|nr:hypothetical protein K7X08_024496 [Anisodus acutangulus]
MVSFCHEKQNPFSEEYTTTKFLCSHFLLIFTAKSHTSSKFLPNPIPLLNQNGPTYSIRAISGTTVDPVATKKKNEDQSPENWKIKMLYDGECPLCMREVDMLRERNKGLDYKTVMGRIHAILSDGTVVTDVEAFRRLYEAVGLGWVYAITKYEPIATIADSVYGVWAKYRLQITGRPSLEEVLEARRKKDEMCKDSKPAGVHQQSQIYFYALAEADLVYKCERPYSCFQSF